MDERENGVHPTGGGQPAISARHLHKIFSRDERAIVDSLGRDEVVDFESIEGTAAVIDASFDVAAGEIFVVMGLSGSGKSTLIRMLNGLNPASYGSVAIDGTDITQVSAEELRQIRRDKISMVFQHFALFPHRTVAENVAYGLKVRGVSPTDRRERAQHWLGIVGLEGLGRKYPDQLSGGMQQRVGLARALAAETPILLMDEAFSALDPLIRTDLQTQLMELQSELGKTIVFITHDLNEAMRLGDRIAIMRQGRVVQIGTGPQILTEPADDYVRRFVQDVDRSRVLFAGQIATEPDHLVQASHAAAEAMEVLERRSAWASVVIDERNHPVGTVHRENLVEGVRVADVMRTDPPVVPSSTPISELFAPAARAETRLAVVDRTGRLVGMVGQDTLLQAMDSTDLGARAESSGAPASRQDQTMGEPA